MSVSISPNLWVSTPSILLSPHIIDQLVITDISTFYASYVHALKQHRTQLFAHHEAYTKTLSTFFSRLLALVDRLQDSWSTRAELLTIFSREPFHVESEETLKDLVRRVINVLDDPSPSAIQCLSTIIQIEYDIINPFLPQIFDGILVLPLREDIVQFMDLLLECSIKTRSLHDLVGLILNAIWQINGPRKATVLDHHPFLDRLGNAIKSFGTVAQSSGLLTHVVGFTERALQSLENIGLKMLLGAKIVCVVVACLPLEMVSSSERESLKELKFKVERVIGKLVRRVKSDAVELEQGLCALLSVKYVFDFFWATELGPSLGKEKSLMRLLERDELLPELVVEVVRTMFLHISTKREDSSGFFDLLLAFVERYYPIDTGWSGKDYDLTGEGNEGKVKCSLSLVWMIVQRWLAEVDSLATPRQIRRFLDVLFVDLEEIKKVDLVNPESILLNMLHSAWFWELGNVRRELVELLKERISNQGSLRQRISTFRVLLYFPLEYFTFQVLSGFVGCAVAADEELVGMWKTGKEDVMRDLVVLRVFVRRACVYVGGGGVLDFRGKTEADLLLGMLEEPKGVKKEYMRASLDLAEVWLMRLLKTSKKTDDPVAVLRVLKAFDPDSIGCQNLTSECFIRMVELLDKESNAASANLGRALKDLSDELVGGLYVRIVGQVSREGLDSDVKVREYVELVRVWDALICLGRGLGLVLDERVDTRFMGDKLVSVLMPHVQLKDAVDGNVEELCIGVFSVLLGELLAFKNQGGGRHLEVVLAIYVALANKVSVSGVKEMDVRLSRTARRLALSDFEHLLSFIAGSLSDIDSGGNDSESRLVRLVHVGSLFIRDHPHHSLPCIQKFMARCMGLFNNNPLYVQGDPTLRLRVLEMVGHYCSDQQAALRAQDTSLIWLLIFKLLAPSQVHDSETRTEIFHKIVSILTCLIRLRRDLVALGLPHLGLILGRLVLALRGCRLNLGTKQLAIVMNTQPRWISHTCSLGGEEARSLSRLLECLTVKTTVRLPFGVEVSNQQQQQRAESLAKPFSKHAAYVLKAYVEAMNDPLCVMSLEVRKEMREGLFALCGVMSLHCRDALMVGGGLDAGGKAVLKAVWKDWEEVRYVGKG